jgi:hypothetical protein
MKMDYQYSPIRIGSMRVEKFLMFRSVCLNCGECKVNGGVR